MSGFFSKLFGGGTKKKEEGSDVETLVRENLDGLLERAHFELSYNLNFSTEENQSQLTIEFQGQDEELLKENEGQLIEAFQLYVKRVIQHNFPEDRTSVIVDCDGYKEQSAQALIDLAEKLKGIALEKGKSVYFRALPPKDRKIIHQYLASDERVKSRSIGEGLYKKIKIYPIKNNSEAQAEEVIND